MDHNVRLIQAVQIATQKLAGTGEFDKVLKDVLAICVEAVGASGGTIYLHDASAEKLVFQHVLPPEVEPKLPSKDMPDDFGAAGSAFKSGSVIRREFELKPKDQWNPFEKATGVFVRSMLVAPLKMGNEDPIGVVQLLNKKGEAFNENDEMVIQSIASVSTMAYLNYRLQEESTRASTLLGMGKVSHDIGNLAASLYATISYSEMAIEGVRASLSEQELPSDTTIYLETLPPMVQDLKQSVDRIVGYSRLISDMSAGRALRPNKTLQGMAEAIEKSAAYLESDARSSHVAIIYELQTDAPPMEFDDLFLFRMVQNLVGNAIKAVKENLDDVVVRQAEEDAILGTVTVVYRFKNNEHILEVSDTGPGMTQETARRILGGTARSQWSKAGGSGWGMRIVLELAASHQGIVEIDSELGLGSTFRIRFPHQGDA